MPEDIQRKIWRFKKRTRDYKCLICYLDLGETEQILCRPRVRKLQPGGQIQPAALVCTTQELRLLHFKVI